MTFFALVLPLFIGSACSDDALPPPDASVDVQQDSAGCTDAQCDDRVFCNGIERCAVDRGVCLAGDPPCPANAMCSEAESRCIANCESMGDLDNDGRLSIVCGGDDCNDADARIAPGNSEVCDAESLDEDCDPTTFGQRDADGDRHVDAMCCNRNLCGDDCDDMNSAVFGGSIEACDMIDNDCDMLIDEQVTSACYPDADADTFAPLGSAAIPTCGDCGTGLTGTAPTTENHDCDDSDQTVNTAAREICNGRDDDCSSGGGAEPAEDEDGDGQTLETYVLCEEAVGSFLRTDCDDRNAERFVGQRNYFSDPVCGAGLRCTCAGGGRGCRSPAGGCTCDDGAWDYDCNGSSDAAPSACTVNCSGPAVLPCGRPGAYYTGTAPPCGSLVGTATSCGTICSVGCAVGLSAARSPIDCR